MSELDYLRDRIREDVASGRAAIVDHNTCVPPKTPTEYLRIIMALANGCDDLQSVLDHVMVGRNEIDMLYGEASEWILALEAWIARQGLQVPTWADVGST